MSVSDVRLRLYHSVQSTQQGRKLAKAATDTGKYVSMTGKAVKSKLAGLFWNDIPAEAIQGSAEATRELDESTPVDADGDIPLS